MKGGNCWKGGRRGRKRTLKGGGYGFEFGNQGGAPIGVAGGMISKVDTGGYVGRPSAGEVAPKDEGGGYAAAGGRRRRSRRTRRKSVAQIKRLLKAKGMKVSGSRRALTARARKARIPLKGGGVAPGTSYGAYAGGGDGGMANLTAGAHPPNDGVQPLPGV
jgi:hypothetical protein